MARDDDSFWLDIFKKSPLIASFMALCGVIGLGIGIYYFHPLAAPRGNIRLLLVLLAGTTVGGIFVGLILGVIADSVGALGDDKKRKPPRGR